MAVDPRNPLRIAVAAMSFPGGAEGSIIRTWWSEDGGVAWSPGDLDPRESEGADPWLTWSPAGTLHLIHLPDGHHVSTDGGRTWNQAERLPSEVGPYDYLKMVTASSDTAGDQRLYIWAAAGGRSGTGGAIVLLRSDRQGRRFRVVQEVRPGDLNYQNGEIVALPDGGIAAAFHEIDRRGEFLESPRLWTVVASPGAQRLNVPVLVRESYVADSPGMTVAPSHGDSVPFTLFLSWTEITEDGGRAAIARSTDGGLTWSEPLGIGRIPPGSYLPHHGAVVADSMGRVIVTWQRAVPDLGQRCFQLHVSISDDRGSTFDEPLAIAPTPSCSDVPGNQVPVSGAPDATTVARRFGDGGDYHGLVRFGDGQYQVVWADSRSGRYRLYTARIAIH